MVIQVCLRKTKVNSRDQRELETARKTKGQLEDMHLGLDLKMPNSLEGLTNKENSTTLMLQ